MSLKPETKDVLTELRALLDKHKAVIIGNIVDADSEDYDDTVILEVSVYNQTIIFEDQIGEGSKAKYCGVNLNEIPSR